MGPLNFTVAQELSDVLEDGSTMWVGWRGCCGGYEVMRVEAGQERGRDSDEDDGLLIFRAVWCGW